METLKIENIAIPVDDIKLKGSIYYTSNTPSKAPCIINCPGLLDHRESYFVKFYTEKFANAGYLVFSYDYRAHGETAEQTGTNWMKMVKEIFSDLRVVISYIIEKQTDRILNDKIALFGRSLGGALILTQGFIDERVKVLIPLCTRYDYGIHTIKFPEEVIKQISPKYFIKKANSNNQRILLAHCKDDERIPFENVLAIKEHLGLADSNLIVYDIGGHSFKGHRDDIFDLSLKFLQKNL